jgi:hypothetical protein
MGPPGTGDTPPAILSQDLKNKIYAAGFEAAAIGFEQKEDNRFWPF